MQFLSRVTTAVRRDELYSSLVCWSFPSWIKSLNFTRYGIMLVNSELIRDVLLIQVLYKVAGTTHSIQFTLTNDLIKKDPHTTVLIFAAYNLYRSSPMPA